MRAIRHRRRHDKRKANRVIGRAALVAKPRNAFLQETLERYLNLSLRIWYLVLDRLPHLFDRVHEHRELLIAIREGDGPRARAIAAEHVETFESEIRGVL